MLNQTQRFHGHNALSFAHQRGKVVRCSFMSLKYIANPRRKHARVAVVVSKKVSKSAVVRNRIRRRLYEAVRLELDAVREPYDLVIMVYTLEPMTIDFTKLQNTVHKQLRQASVV